MAIAMKPAENPFPAKAVTTFGAGQQTAAEFAYMREAREHLVNYLKDYPRSGGALALSGGHGSGKTFLLNWLTAKAADIKTRAPQTVYAKADNDSLPDIYRQLFRSITRVTLIEVTRAALQNIGQKIAASAKATERTSEEMKTQGLQPALDEKLFDTNELYLRLKRELEGIGVSPAISAQVSYAIGVLEHSDFGEAAFTWLTGGEPQLPKEMPIQTSLWVKDSVDASDIAASALECIAALYRLADKPLILAVDQMENFLSGGASSATQASLLKKLVEQLSLQGAFLLMAGTPAAWERLPRDVGPRLINRAPLLIGGLNVEEATLLLNAYMRTTPGFTSQAVQKIRDLSGGNAREILRIAHQAFNISHGSPGAIESETLIRAAQDSGSLADRMTLALQMIDLAVAGLKLSAHPSATAGGHEIHRMVESPNGGRLAVVLMASADAHREATDARKLAALRQELAAAADSAELLVIAVGYSSGRVRELVKEFSGVLEFHENDFRAAVERSLRRISPARQNVARESAEFSPLIERLEKLDARLAGIEASRIQVERDTEDALQRGSVDLTEIGNVEAELRTRHELRFGLDELHEALTRGDYYDERRMLRRLLVANEANVKDPAFDYLGTLYLDALDSVQLAGESDSEFLGECALLRSELIRTMRTNLSRRPVPFRSRRWGLAGAVLGVLLAFFTMELVFYELRVIFGLAQASFLTVVSSAIVGGLGFWYAELTSSPERKFSYFAYRLSRLRDSRSIRRRLPG